MTDGHPPPTRDRELVRGLVMITIAMTLLPVQDAMAKLAAATVPIAEISWARFMAQTLFSLPFLLRAQGIRGLVPNRLWPNVIRGALIVMSSACFFVGLQYMPLADTLAIFFVSPFVLTILSAVFGGEQVGWPRRAAVLVGFIGALIVIRPSYATIGPVALVPVIGATLFAVYALLTRKYAPYDTPLTMQFVSGCSGAILTSAALVLGLFAPIPGITPVPLGWHEMLFLFVMGVAGTTGHLFVVKAARHVPNSIFAPFQYLEIVAATILGYAIFGDFPDALKWLGIGIIVASGVYVFWRESRRR